MDTAAPTPESDWSTYHDPAGVFSFQAPGAVSGVDHDQKASLLGPYTMHFEAASTQHAQFQLGVIDVTPVLTKHTEMEIIESARDFIGDKFGTKNIVVSKCIVDGCQGMEYQIDLAEGAYPVGSKADFRLFIASGKLIEQIVLGAGNAVTGPDRNRFFKSLTLKASLKTGPTGSGPPAHNSTLMNGKTP